MKMKNQDVIHSFITQQAAESHTGNLYTVNSGRNFKLMNYQTCLAEITQDKGVIVNGTKYSSTTSKIQTWLRAALSKAGLPFTEVTNIEIDTQSLGGM